MSPFSDDAGVQQGGSEVRIQEVEADAPISNVIAEHEARTDPSRDSTAKRQRSSSAKGAEDDPSVLFVPTQREDDYDSAG
jgi:hypothetical protein